MPEKKFEGSRFVEVNPNVMLGCISQDARQLLDVVMAEWEIHYGNLKQIHGENYEPGNYGFAYWLIRWSGLIEPSEIAKQKANAVCE